MKGCKIIGSFYVAWLMFRVLGGIGVYRKVFSVMISY